MDNWDSKRYEQEKRKFIERRIHQAPLWSQLTLIFAASWGGAWFCSWFLLHFFAESHFGAGSLPIRYAIAFLFAYACFFAAVRVWIEIVKQEPQHQNGLGDLADFGNGGFSGADSEGCLIVLITLVIGFIVGGLFFAVGGAPLLLEAAFEAAFAGVVVRRWQGNYVLGDWKMQLLGNTWKQALVCLVVLVTVAAWLQHQAPQARTFAEAVRTLTHGDKK